MVKKLNLRTGVPFSILISMIVGLLRLIESADFSMSLLLTCYYFITSLICWMGNILLINSRFVKRPEYNKQLFYLISILSSILLSLLFAYSSTILRGKALVVDGTHTIGSSREFLFFFFRGIMLNLFNAFLASHIKQMKDHEQSQLELEHLKQAHLQANLSSLKEQLSPHFLFNTFNTLSSLTSEQQVKDYVDQMANVYRYLLDYQKKDLVDLKQELAFVKSYLYIMQMRLEAALQITMQIDIDSLQYMIPPLTLQLLVENAIKHNITSTSRPLRISIYTRDGYLAVVNNLQPKTSVQASSGIGLTNINQRYLLLFAREIRIEMDDHSFTVKLPLYP
jgi:two-component system LytT family sensor kinase